MHELPPSHIAAAALPGTPFENIWGADLWDEVLLHQPRIENRVARMSDRAALAFSLGAIEWIVWRFQSELPDGRPFQFLQAAWAGLVDWRYLASFDLPEWDDEGGPLAQACWLLEESFVAARDHKPFFEYPVSISDIALRVCGQPESFKVWRRTAIGRLIETDPRNRSAPTGRPVPRDLIDPAYTPSPTADNRHIASFIASLDWQTNPFLQAPDVMRADGFNGEPYTWPPLEREAP
jgi:hypothetical protein